MTNTLGHLIEQLDDTRANIKATEKRISDLQHLLAELKNQETRLRRQIERAAHLAI
jgi:septal ring factor EnvC (AmiA/AmiB activator)